jgi:ubiquinone/menaquinone biosynthesis C-methylase UbiE
MYWSRFAAQYADQVIYVVGREIVESIAHRLEEQEKLGTVLELGCGPGTYTGNLAASADRVIATDFSQEMVEAARQRFEDHERVTVERANCFELTYGDNSFDTVFMANLLHVIPNPEKALAETFRVLKAGGRVIAASITAEGMKFFHKLGMVGRYLKTWGKPPSGGSLLTVDKVENMMQECGFSGIEGALIGNKSKCVFVTAWKK